MLKNEQIVKIENIIENSLSFDLDDVIQGICFDIGGTYKYDVLLHRFFKEERYNGMFPEGWFCHLVVYEYDGIEEDWDKNDDMSVKVFGCRSPKVAVVEALKKYLENEM